MSSKIKILVACHKPSELPKNNLLLPVQVGAAKAKVNLGLQRDDDGKDNISNKNSGYCELTAIYWAWKNLDADYYGLFHYRRFYSFANKKFPVSDDGHMMIRAKILSPEVFRKYGLEDEAAMRRLIEANDLIIHDARPVRGIPTPIGTPGSTVYEHYKLHDGTIIKLSDIDQMLEVTKQLYPQVYPYIQEYMQGHTFLGYNMFIMRKRYFKAMCDFEFTILKKMEELLTPDLPNRSINGNRIYGYLAEILTSAYIYYIRQANPQLKVKHLQMIYALKTDPITPLKPIAKAVPIVINFTSGKQSQSFYLDTTVRQLISQRKQSNYDIVIAYKDNLSSFVQQSLLKTASKNVSIRFANFADFIDQLQETHGETASCNLKAALPYFLPEFNRVTVLDWHTWVKTDLGELSNTKLGEHLLAAAQNIMDYGYLYDINANQPVSNANKLSYLKLDLNNYFNTGVMLLDLAKLRAQLTLDQVVSTSCQLASQNDNVIMNSLKLSPLVLDSTWSYQLPTNEGVTHTANFLAPISLGQAWKTMGDAYKVGKFYPADLTADYSSPFLVEFYHVMKDSSLWPLFLATRITKPDEQNVKYSWRHNLAPTGSRRREFIKKLLPRGSKRRAAIEKTYRKLIRRG